MSDEKKEGSCCSGSGCGCCAGAKKLVVGLLIGALLFASGVWFANAKCWKGGAKMCPMSGMPMEQR